MVRDQIKTSLTTALNLGSSFSSAVQRRDRLGVQDKQDLYRFSLENRSSFALEYSKSGSGKVGLQLFTLKQAKPATLKAVGRSSFNNLKTAALQKYFTSIRTTSIKDSKPQSLALTLNAGEYYVRFFRISGANLKYRFALTATPLSSAVEQPDSSPTKGNPGTTPSPSPSPSVISPTPAPAPSPAPTPPHLPQFSSSAQKWLRQFGTVGNDYAYGSTTDSAGNSYIAGETGASGTQTGNGFVAKYSPDGQLSWQRTLPISGADIAFDLVLDQAGNYYVAGAYNVSATTSDAFIAKYDSAGQQVWFTPITSSVRGIPAVEVASGITLDGDGNLFAAGFQQMSVFPGFSGDAFVAKLNSSTGQLMTGFAGDGIAELNGAQNGADAASKVVVDGSGNVYIAGITDATLPVAGTISSQNQLFRGGSTFVASFNAAGNLRWQNVLDGNAAVQDYARDLVVSGSSVYITGQTEIALPGNTYAGSKDGFVAKYSTDGTRQWVKQFGTSGLEEAQTIAVDNAGRIYLAGETNQSLFGSYYGGSDAWVAVYDSNGNRLKGIQIGTLSDDEIYSASVNGNSLYLIGQTEGAFSGYSNQGSHDAWLAQYDVNLI